MNERKAFVAWLEATEPKLPTTHDVEVAWRAWTARSAMQPETVRFGDIPQPDSIHGFPQDESCSVDHSKYVGECPGCHVALPGVA